MSQSRITTDCQQTVVGTNVTLYAFDVPLRNKGRLDLMHCILIASLRGNRSLDIQFPLSIKIRMYKISEGIYQIGDIIHATITKIR